MKLTKILGLGMLLSHQAQTPQIKVGICPQVESAYGPMNKLFFKGLHDGDTNEVVFATQNGCMNEDIPAYPHKLDRPQDEQARAKYFAKTLHQAIETSDPRLVHALLKKGDFYATKYHAMRALDKIISIQTEEFTERDDNALSVFKRIFENLCFSEHLSGNDIPALLDEFWNAALHEGAKEVIKYFIDVVGYKVDRELPESSYGYKYTPGSGATALFAISYRRYRMSHYAYSDEIFDQLLAAGANVDVIVNIRDGVQFTPLIQAIMSGNDRAFDKLIAAEADVNLLAPLYYAVLFHETRMAQILLEHGADPDQIRPATPRDSGIYWLNLARPQFQLDPIQEQNVLEQYGPRYAPFIRKCGPWSGTINLHDVINYPLKDALFSLEQKGFYFSAQALSALGLAREIGNKGMYALTKSYSNLPTALIPQFRKCNDDENDTESITEKRPSLKN